MKIIIKSVESGWDTERVMELPEDEVPMKIAMGAGSATVICESGNVYWWGMKYV